MKRILVLGSGGSGKTTFSRKMAEKTALPLYHLDSLYWKPGWIEPEKTEWRAKLTDLVAQEEWIIDGSYGGTLDLRVPRAELIIFLDISPYHCIWNILKRRIKYARFTGLARPGMAPGCPESIWFSFLIWVWRYRRVSKPKVLNTIKNMKNEQAQVLIFNSYGAMDVFLSQLHSTPISV